MDDVNSRASLIEREQLRAAMSFETTWSARAMDFEDVTIRADVTLEVVLRYLR